jgi:hypothetical protein
VGDIIYQIQTFIYSTNQPPAALLLFARCIVVVLIGVPLSPLLAAATAAAAAAARSLSLHLSLSPFRSHPAIFFCTLRCRS